MAQVRKQVDSKKGHLTKAEKEHRKKEEEKLYGDNSKLKAPSHLSEDAKKEFKRVVKEMQSIVSYSKSLSNLDLSMLAIYADAYTNYVNLTKEIAENGTVIKYTNKAKETNLVISPYVQAQQKYIDILFKCSSKMGLSLCDRLKLVVPNTEKLKENKFVKYVK